MPETGILKIDLKTAALQPLARRDPLDRTTRGLQFPVLFKTSFALPPLVMVSLTALKADPGQVGLEFSLQAVQVTAKGFKMQLSLGPDDKITCFYASWIAIDATPADAAQQASEPDPIGSLFTLTNSPFSQ